MRHNENLGSFLLYFIFLVSEVLSFTPDPRSGQTSNLIGTKLYYIGGISKQTSNEIFYLDLSSSFQVNSPPWVSIAEASVPVALSDATSIVGPLDDDTIFLIGGFTRNPLSNLPDFNVSLRTFDSVNKKWSIPNISGNIPTGRQEMQAVVNSAGKVYIFGGCVIVNYTSFMASYYNDMNILDISANTWTYVQATLSSPSPRADYTATLLPNGVIVYIGGWDGIDLIADIKQLQLFNTTDLSWSSMNSTGVYVQERRLHTAVLAGDDKIIIYGGTTKNYSLVTPNLAVLNISSYSWYIPNTSTGSNAPPPLGQHSANSYGNYMIIAFGYIVDTQGNITNLNKNLYFLDTTNYAWVDQFVALPSPTTSPSSTSPKPIDSNENMGLIIGLSVSLGLLGLVGIFGLIFYLTKKRTHERILEIASEESMGNEN